MAWSTLAKKNIKKTLVWIKNKRFILNLIKYGIISAIFFTLSAFILFRLEINAHVYVRSWFSPPQPLVVEPLSSCFNNLSDNSPYHQGSQKFSANFVPGLPVWEAHTCYDFAALFKPQRYSYDGDQTFHTYWSSNLTGNTFEEKQVATLRSFSATQNSNHSLIVWISAEDEQQLTQSESWNYLIASLQTNKQQQDRITYRVADPQDLVQDTPIEPYIDPWVRLLEKDNDGEGRNDLLRMLVLYRYGGVWFDLNTMFVRDLGPLLEHEWIAQGSCSTGMFGNPFTGALFHFHQRSPYVCEVLEGAADLFRAREQVAAAAKDSSSNSNLNPPQKRYLITGPEIFGSKLYYRIYRRLLHHGIKPWSILPWCFTDPSQCRRTNSLSSMFKNTNLDEKRVLQTFAYHWRDRWTAVPGTIFKYLDSMHKKRINW